MIGGQHIVPALLCASRHIKKLVPQSFTSVPAKVWEYTALVLFSVALGTTTYVALDDTDTPAQLTVHAQSSEFEEAPAINSLHASDSPNFVDESSLNVVNSVPPQSAIQTAKSPLGPTTPDVVTPSPTSVAFAETTFSAMPGMPRETSAQVASAGESADESLWARGHGQLKLIGELLENGDIAAAHGVYKALQASLRETESGRRELRRLGDLTTALRFHDLDGARRAIVPAQRKFGVTALRNRPTSIITSAERKVSGYK